MRTNIRSVEQPAGREYRKADQTAPMSAVAAAEPAVVAGTGAASAIVGTAAERKGLAPEASPTELACLVASYTVLAA
jgi:hypothetical protein